MTFIKPREPGGELNFKAKRRWEILRRTDSYRQDWDKAFAEMVKMLKEISIIGSDDFECNPDREKMKELIDELMKDPPAWKDFLNRKFERDWPPGKLKQEFLYSRTQGRKLADKYGLSIPYKYDDPVWDPFKDRMIPVFNDGWPVTIISHNPASYEMGQDHEVIADHTPNLREKRWLTIEIDLLEKIGTIRKEINSQLDFYQKLLSLPKAKKRDRTHEFYLDTPKGKVSFHELWDMNKKDGKSPWQIAMELYPSETKGTSYQPASKKFDPRVRSYQSRIEAAIKTIDSEIKSLSLTPY